MLQPHLQDISPNDFGDWQAFCDANHDSRNAHAWFLLTIGLQGFEGTTLFQVLVATPAALASATGNDRSRRVLVVETFTPDLIEEALRDFVQSAAAARWETVLERLQGAMYWEFEKQWC